MMTRLEPGDQRLWIAAAVPAGALLLYLLAGRSAEPVSIVELVSPQQRPPAAAAPAAPLLPVAAPAPPSSAEGLRLYGLLGGGAIVGLADGSQRFVRVGRELLPGLRVARVEQHHLVLASAGGELRLGFDGAAPVQTSAPSATAAVTASAGTRQAAWRDETLRYRIGLEPRRANGRISGFTLRPGARLPSLQRAGLRSGDLILRVNGSAFDEERMLELAWQMDNADRVEFEIERRGRRMTIVTNRP